MANRATAASPTAAAPVDFEQTFQAWETQKTTALTALDEKETTINNQIADLQEQLETVATLRAKFAGANGHTATAAPARRGRPVGSTNKAAKPVKPVKAKTATATGRGQGPRGSNEMTLFEITQDILGKNRKGLSYSDIAVKAAGDYNYKTTADPESFSKSVYSSGIVTGIKQGLIIKVGKRPNLLFKLTKYATPTEKSEFKKMK